MCHVTTLYHTNTVDKTQLKWHTSPMGEGGGQRENLGKATMTVVHKDSKYKIVRRRSITKKKKTISSSLTYSARRL